MKLPIYHIDAFSQGLFSGNPAAVCLLKDSWPPDALLQNIAMENNLSETAFYLCKDTHYHIRWFTPNTEVDLCGHATLATAYVIFTYEKHPGSTVRFVSRSGDLFVKKDGDLLTLDFPTDTLERIPMSRNFASCFDVKPIDVYKGKTDYLLIFEHEDQIQNVVPDFEHIASIPCRGIIVTAKGHEVDFVCRFFGPRSGINEDPVTGSAYTTLVPYWSKILQKTNLTAKQLSKRGGLVSCRFGGDRTEISGKATTYLVGAISV